MGLMDYLKTEDRTKKKEKDKQEVGKKVAKTATSAIKTRKQKMAEAAREY